MKLLLALLGVLIASVVINWLVLPRDVSAQEHYLNHFCTEGPEPYNAYSGNVVTDDRG